MWLSSSRLVAIALLAAVVAVGPASAREAGEPEDGPGFGPSSTGVVFDVQVILANKVDSFVDRRVAPIRERLAALFDYTHYVQLSAASKATSMLRRVRFHLPGGRFLRLHPRDIDARGRLRMMVEIEDLFQTEFRMVEGGTLILGGPRTDNGVLVLVIRARFEQGTGAGTPAVLDVPRPPPLEP